MFTPINFSLSFLGGAPVNAAQYRGSLVHKKVQISPKTNAVIIRYVYNGLTPYDKLEVTKDYMGRYGARMIDFVPANKYKRKNYHKGRETSGLASNFDVVK